MGIYLGATELSSGGGGGSGGSLTEVTFTASGNWTVPADVLDDIASNGSRKIQVFLVGGGSTSSNISGVAGQIVSQSYDLTTASYNSSNQIPINVGSSGGDSTFGFDDSNPTVLRILSPSSLYSTAGGGPPGIYTESYPPTVIRGTNGIPIVTRIQSVGNTTVTGTYLQDGSNQPTYPFIGSPTGYSSQTNQITLSNGGTFQSRYHWVSPATSYSIDFVVGVSLLSASNGNSTSNAGWLNNPHSEDGYFGGYGRATYITRTDINSPQYAGTVGTQYTVPATPNSGMPGQSGIVKIFY